MNRSLPFACSLLCVIATHAQIPNPGFEDWTNMGSYEDPAGYVSWNALTAQYGELVCTEASPGHTGASCMRLQTQFVEGMGAYAPGIATTGNLVVEGFPCTDRPEQLLGWWKYATGGGIDQALVLVTFTKWNNLTQERDDIGSGVLFTEGSVNDWTAFNVPISYGSVEPPDTATIIFDASGSGIPDPASTLYVDDLAFDTSTGLDAMPHDAQVSVVDGVLHLWGVPPGRVRVVDALGRELSLANGSTDLFMLDVSDQPPGLLLVEWMDESGRRKVFRSMR